MAGVSLSLDNPVFHVFMGHVALLLLKTLALGVMTAYYRITKGVYVNPEDLKMAGLQKKGMVHGDPDVDRITRVHHNDLENVIPFILIGLVYVTIGPGVAMATLHFRIFTAARFIHTVVYFFILPQPSRALSFFVGGAVNISMCLQILSQAAF